MIDPEHYAQQTKISELQKQRLRCKIRCKRTQTV